MSKKRISILMALVLLLSAFLAACATPTPEPTEEPEPVAEEPAEEPMEEEPMEEEPMEEEMMLDLSDQTVVFWHPFSSGDQLEGINAIVAEFNETNEYGITVEAIEQGRQNDLETAVNAGIASGDLPNVTGGFANGLASWYNVGVIADLNQFINDPDYGLSEDEYNDIFPGVLGAGTLADGSQIGVPMHQSANVHFYNATWAQELGFDSPPSNTAEFKEQACAAAAANANDDDPDNDGTGGYVLFPGASNVANWIYAFGADIVDETGNDYALDSQAVKDVALFLKDLQDNGCTFSTESFPNPEFATRKALFTDSSTAGIPFQLAAFEDAGNDDEWTLLPFAGPDGTQAINAFGQMVGIVDTNEDANLASWLWLKYFTSPETQATWIGYSAYFPSQSATFDLIGDFTADNPIYTLGLDLLPLGNAEPPIPAHGSVRGAIQDAFFAVLAAADEAEIDQILADLDATAAELVAETQ